MRNPCYVTVGSSREPESLQLSGAGHFVEVSCNSPGVFPSTVAILIVSSHFEIRYSFHCLVTVLWAFCTIDCVRFARPNWCSFCLLTYEGELYLFVPWIWCNSCMGAMRIWEVTCNGMIWNSRIVREDIERWFLGVERCLNAMVDWLQRLMWPS